MSDFDNFYINRLKTKNNPKLTIRFGSHQDQVICFIFDHIHVHEVLGITNKIGFEILLKMLLINHAIIQQQKLNNIYLENLEYFPVCYLQVLVNMQ